MVYLIHFSRPLFHAKHYVGFAEKSLDDRISKHLQNQGSKLLKAANKAEIDWEVVWVWNNGNRGFERWLKNKKNSCKFCPICSNHSAEYLENLYRVYLTFDTTNQPPGDPFL